MDRGHWIGIKPNPKIYFGFIYTITNKLNGRIYIGRKVYHRRRKKKIIGESDWREYTGSSKKLNADITKYGRDNFEFKIIKHTRNAGIHRYLEIKEIIKRDAILKKNEGKYYNGQVEGCKYRPVE